VIHSSYLSLLDRIRSQRISTGHGSICPSGGLAKGIVPRYTVPLGTSSLSDHQQKKNGTGSPVVAEATLIVESELGQPSPAGLLGLEDHQGAGLMARSLVGQANSLGPGTGQERLKR